MPADDLVWGLIGASTIAHEWMVDAIRSDPRSRVSAVASSNRDRARAFAAEKKIPNAYGSVEEVIRDKAINAVYISTTNERHCAEAVAAARSGKHVLCEKPLALNVTDAEEIVKACHAANVVLGTNHHLRNVESHRTIKRLMDEGAVGTVTSLRILLSGELPKHLQTWRLFKKEAGGGVVLDLTVHSADLLRFYLGRNPTKITALATTSGDGPPDIEDSAMSIWEFPDNILAQCHDSFVVGHGASGVEVHGRLGSIFGRDIMSQTLGGEVVLRTAAGERSIPFEDKNPYIRSVAEFVSAIRGDGRPSATGEDGVWSLRLALAVAKSAADGEPVAID